jgi:OPA family glycerol-3-phosphate transporter-like MFS transporter
LQDEYGYSKGARGLLASGFFGAYAVGQLINGVLGDRFNARYFVSLGLLTAGISNVMFSFMNQLPLMFIFWAINGYFQSMLWAPMVRVISNVTPSTHQHGAMQIMSLSPAAGFLLSYILVGRIAINLGWKWTFLLPGLFMIGASGLWFWSLKGIKMSPSETTASSQKQNTGTQRKENVFSFILRSGLPVIIFLCILAGMAREGLTLWGPVFFSETSSFNMDQVFFVMSLLPVMNLLSVILTGILNRKNHYNEKRTILMISVVSLLFAILLAVSMKGSFLFLLLSYGGLLAALYGTSNIMNSYFPLNFQKEGRISTAAGIVDSAFYAGAAVSGPVIGFLADRFNWTAISYAWIAVCVIVIVLILFSRDYKRD